MFQAPKLTDAGKALYYENMAGTQLTFTTIKLGDGAMSGPIAAMTDLVNTVVTITAAATARSDYAEVAGAFSNAGLQAGFYWREIGVFAANPDDPTNRAADILYCYQNAYDTADYIPVASVETVEKNITVPVIVGDATAISCTLSESQIYMTQDKRGSANGVASLGADTKVPNGQLYHGTKETPADADQVPVIDSDASSKTKLVLWSKIKALFAAATHSHAITDVNDLETSLSNKVDKTRPTEYDLPLNTGWEHTHSYDKCSYCKTQDGMVTVCFSAGSNSQAVAQDNYCLIAMLPSGYRPSEAVIGIAESYNYGTALLYPVWIQSDGQIIVANVGTSAPIGVGGSITFRAAT